MTKQFISILLAIISSLMFIQTSATSQPVRAQLNESIRLIEVERVFNEFGIFGFGAGVLIIDNFDDIGCNDAPHGEPVAEIISRVAPSANLLFFNSSVLDPVTCDTLPQTRIIEGLFKAINFAEAQGVSVINMSFGVSDLTLCDRADALENEFLNILSESGIILVAAAGNEGYANVINHPACLPNVISVGAVYDDDGTFTDLCEEFGIEDWLTCYTNRSAHLDLVAPGSAITTFADASFDGTSAAAPIVTGVIALMLEADPTLRRDEILEILKSTGDDAFDPINNINFPRVNAFKAVEEVLIREGKINQEVPRPGLGLSALAILDFYDFNENRALDDDELFMAVDDWIDGRILDSEFFILLDAWILDLNIKQQDSVLTELRLYDLNGQLINEISCRRNSERLMSLSMKNSRVRNGVFILETRDCISGIKNMRPIARVD